MPTWPPSFAGRLANWGNDDKLQERRFIPRNYLLDERTSPARVGKYLPLGAPDYPEFDDWHPRHEAYLDKWIRRTGAHGLHPLLMRDEAPDTFVVDPQFTPYSHASHELELVRVMTIGTLARLAKRTPPDVLATIEDTASAEALFEEISEGLDGRPVFAAFLEDVAELLPDDASDAPPNWADQLRNALGLWHLSPPPGRPIRVLVLRYPIEDVVRLQGMGRDRPLTVPTVLDSEQFEAFCPAPISLPVGQLVGLDGQFGRAPAGEILHPATPLRASHVFRVGSIHGASPALDGARGAHITWLQVETGTEFGAGLDDDVLSL